MKVHIIYICLKQTLNSVARYKMPAKSVNTYVKEWGSMSSMHGIPWLVSAQTRKTRILWIIICTLAMMMFIYMLLSLIVKYYQYPVSVKVDQVSNIFCHRVLYRSRTHCPSHVKNILISPEFCVRRRHKHGIV